MHPATTRTQVLRDLIPDIDAMPDLSPSEFIKVYWTVYKEVFPDNSSLNGAVFEALISMALCRESILPHYMQAHLWDVPVKNYDCIIYTREFSPVALSAKMTLRERWKQADHEAVALRHAYRAPSFLVSVDALEIARRRRNPASVQALIAFVLATGVEFDVLLELIESWGVIPAPSDAVASARMPVTSGNYKSIWFF
jgi:hypothetical protein